MLKIRDSSFVLSLMAEDSAVLCDIWVRNKREND